MRNLEQLHERANGAVLSHQNLHRPNKCQKRPTIGAKETYYVAPLAPFCPLRTCREGVVRLIVSMYVH